MAKAKKDTITEPALKLSDKVQFISGDEKIYLRPAYVERGTIEGHGIALVMVEPVKPRRGRKGEIAREILREIPVAEMSSSAVRKAFLQKCDQMALPEEDRVSPTQLLRIINRKKD